MSANGTLAEPPVNLWELKLSPALLTLLSVAYTLVFALSLVGNAAVIVTVYRLPTMHTAINYFICNLSTADILMAIFCLPLNLIANTFTNWVAGRALCKAMPYLQGVAVAASVTTLSVIAFDRYLAICRPLKRHLSKKQTVGFIVAIWTYVLLLLSPWVITYDLQPHREANATYLSCRSTMTPLYNRVYQLGIIFCLLYAGPLLFIVVCYALVAHKLSRRSVNQEEFLRKSSTAQDKKQMSRLIKMLVTVVLIFALSWLPLHVIAIMLNFLENPGSLWFMPYLEQGLPVIQWIGISNCCVNPWIYCAFSKSYRTNFFNTLRCKFKAPAVAQQHRSQHQQQQHLLSGRSPHRTALAAAGLMEASDNAATAVTEVSTRRPLNQSSWRRRNGPEDSIKNSEDLDNRSTTTIPLFERNRNEEAKEAENDDEADLATDEV